MTISLRTLCCSLILGGSSYLYAQQPIKITGNIEGVGQGRLHLVIPISENRVDTIASTDFNSPHFTLEATIQEATGAHILLDKHTGGFFFFAEPGKTYTAHLTNGNNAYIQGEGLQQTWLDYQKSLNNYRITCDSLQNVFEELKRQSKFRSASEADKHLRAYQQKEVERIRTLLASHDDVLPAYINYMYTIQQSLDAFKSKQQYDKLGKNAQHSIYGRMLAERITRLEAATSGKPAPDFTLNTPEGNPVTLSQVKAKIKIVDFWASWCGPCRLNNPKIKEIYEIYKEKGLEIIGVSLDENMQRWKEAIQKDGLPWIHVSSLKGWKCPIANLYGVSMVPALFVIDANNKIIATDLKGDALKEFIENILDK